MLRVALFFSRCMDKKRLQKSRKRVNGCGGEMVAGNND